MEAAAISFFYMEKYLVGKEEKKQPKKC